MTSAPNHLARAAELQRLQRYDLALQEVQRALAQTPHASAPHICAAWILRDQQRLPEAEEAARAALAAEPNDPEAQHILAVLLWAQNRREQAQQAFEAALALVGGNRALYLANYARMMTTYQRYSEALIALNLATQALALSPSFADPHEIRALALRQLGRDAEAEAAFLAALRLDPRSFSTLHNLGLHDLTLGRTDAAIDRFREALRLNPNSKIAHHNLTLALKARNPIYGYVLSSSLRSKLSLIARNKPAQIVPSEHPPMPHAARWVLGTCIGLLVLAVVVSTLNPELVPVLSAICGWGFLVLFLAGIGRLIWVIAAGPIINILRLLKLRGRQEAPYDPVDGAVVAGVIVLLIGLLGVAITFPLLGTLHPISGAMFILCLGAVAAMVIAAAIRPMRGTGRRLAWIGYAMISTAMLSVIGSELGSAAGLDAVAEICTILVELLLPIGLVVYLIGRSSARRAGDAQRKQGV